MHGVHFAGSATVGPGSTTSSLAGSTLSGLAVTTGGSAGNTSTMDYKCGHHFRWPHAGQQYAGQHNDHGECLCGQDENDGRQ
jgi:hypothetical protein